MAAISCDILVVTRTCTAMILMVGVAKMLVVVPASLKILIYSV